MTPPAPATSTVQTVQPAAVVAPPKKGRQQSTYDLDEAARLVREVCLQTPNRAVSRAAIERALSQVTGFTKVPTKQLAAWLGCRNLDTLLKELAVREPGLAVSKHSTGGYLQIRFVGELPATPSSEAVSG